MDTRARSFLAAVVALLLTVGIVAVRLGAPTPSVSLSTSKGTRPAALAQQDVPAAPVTTTTTTSIPPTRTTTFPSR